MHYVKNHIYVSGARIKIKSQYICFEFFFCMIIDTRIYPENFASFDNVLSFDMTTFTRIATFFKRLE